VDTLQHPLTSARSSCIDAKSTVVHSCCPSAPCSVCFPSVVCRRCRGCYMFVLCLTSSVCRTRRQPSTKLPKDNVDVFTSFLVEQSNRSLAVGVKPSIFTSAGITPLLKNADLDPVHGCRVISSDFEPIGAVETVGTSRLATTNRLYLSSSELPPRPHIVPIAYTELAIRRKRQS